MECYFAAWGNNCDRRDAMRLPTRNRRRIHLGYDSSGRAAPRQADCRRPQQRYGKVASLCRVPLPPSKASKKACRVKGLGPSAIGAAIPFPGVYLGNAVADFRSRRWQLRSRLEDRAMIRTQTARRVKKVHPGITARQQMVGARLKIPISTPKAMVNPETHTPAGLWHWGFLWRSAAAARR